MPTLHIVHGGISNGDKRWLERAAKRELKSPSWVAPKTAVPGDEVVIYVGGYGFFATGRVASRSEPRSDWPNRYGAGLASIRLITPAISLAAIRHHIPALAWAAFPRSITTPGPEIAEQIRSLIKRRRKTGLPDLDAYLLDNANVDELRRVALLSARSVSARTKRLVYQRARSRAIHLYVLRRANGNCEGCGVRAPFLRADGRPYLEPHHTTRLADDGPDHPAKVIGLCPTCHRRSALCERWRGIQQHSPEEAKVS